jgi:hypothetical protein
MSNWIISSGSNLYILSLDDTYGSGTYGLEPINIPSMTAWDIFSQSGVNVSAPFQAIGVANNLLYVLSSGGTLTPFTIGFQFMNPVIVSWQMNSSGQITFDPNNIYTGCAEQNGQLLITTAAGTVINSSANFGVPIATNQIIFPYVYQITTGAVGTI